MPANLEQTKFFCQLFPNPHPKHGQWEHSAKQHWTVLSQISSQTLVGASAGTTTSQGSFSSSTKWQCMYFSECKNKSTKKTRISTSLISRGK
jgi:thiamine phosphate synthase YjbQ (UPF0047 family)